MRAGRGEAREACGSTSRAARPERPAPAEASSAGEPRSSAPPGRPEPRDGVSIPAPRSPLTALLSACCHGDRGSRPMPAQVPVRDGCFISAQCVRLVFL